MTYKVKGQISIVLVIPASKDNKDCRFFFIAVEKESPFNVEVYELDQDAIQKGREDYLADIATYKKCLETNNWHGYTEDKSINILSLPKWVK